MKHVFKITMMSTIPIFTIGYVLESEWIIHLACLVFALACGGAGIKGLIDPLNFDWDEFIVNFHVPKEPRQIRWHIAFVRFKSIIILSISLFVIYIVLMGKI